MDSYKKQILDDELNPYDVAEELIDKFYKDIEENK